MTRLAYEGTSNELYDASVSFFELLVEKSLEEVKLGIETISHLYDYQVEPTRYKILLNTTKKLHDDKLDKRGQFGLERRCNQFPFDPQLKKKKKFQLQRRPHPNKLKIRRNTKKC